MHQQYGNRDNNRNIGRDSRDQQYQYRNRNDERYRRAQSHRNRQEQSSYDDFDTGFQSKSIRIFVFFWSDDTI